MGGGASLSNPVPRLLFFEGGKQRGANGPHKDIPNEKNEGIISLHKFAIGIYEPNTRAMRQDPRLFTKTDVLRSIMSMPGANITCSLATVDPADFHDASLPPVPYVTPLVQAIIHKNSDAINPLIKFGADINAVLPFNVPYSVPGLEALPEGSTVLMISLYMLYDAMEYAVDNRHKMVKDGQTGQRRSVSTEAHHGQRSKPETTAEAGDDQKYHDQNMNTLACTRCVPFQRNARRPKSWLGAYEICHLLLEYEEIDVDSGFQRSNGELENAITVVQRMAEKVRSAGCFGPIPLAIELLHKKIVSYHMPDYEFDLEYENENEAESARTRSKSRPLIPLLPLQTKVYKDENASVSVSASASVRKGHARSESRWVNPQSSKSDYFFADPVVCL
jgi:hypothetical protein